MGCLEDSLPVDHMKGCPDDQFLGRVAQVMGCLKDGLPGRWVGHKKGCLDDWFSGDGSPR